ncbi:excinuclease ABC subunit C [Rhodanobacter fulvus Jip2]|uniref:Excinuclease ABC subunit C n=1 Tax=Rhodanobacter fulvus Jip2 TaxID=1163408 RepID=I4VS30_9GAMM|nr:GIY-YIG nuclease family protein [Rhodanobacter fulvus]EIL90021.1 excinuclease ABC subunit C [Rhodanobacter fulvus Jip2]
MSDAPGATAWAVYLLECADGRVYTGIARDPGQRYAKHLAGKGARFTRSNPPKQMLGWVWVASHGEALRLEIAWKRLPRAQRIAALHERMSLANGCGARASIVHEGE